MMSELALNETLPDSPYPGIKPFSYAERNVFFARDGEVRELTRLIVMHRGVLLYSDSGTGKTSLINAGVIPLAINEGFRPEKIRVRPIKGGEIIVEQISTKTDGKAPFLPSIFTHDKQQKHVVLPAEEFEGILRQLDLAVRPLLIFDQFEELIKLFEADTSEEMRTAQGNIQDMISSLINDNTLPVKVLIVLQGDYLAKLTPFFERCSGLSDRYLRLDPLRGEQIIRVILNPFEKYPGRFKTQLDSSLAHKIQKKFEYRRDIAGFHLTELQIVCRELFETGKSGKELEEHFSNQGDLKGILESFVERSIESLDIKQRDPAVCLVARMITPNRKIIPREELLSLVSKEDGISSELLSETLYSLEQGTKLIRHVPGYEDYRYEIAFNEIADELIFGWIQAKVQQLEEKKKLTEDKTKLMKEKRAFVAPFYLIALNLLIIFVLIKIWPVEIPKTGDEVISLLPFSWLSFSVPPEIRYFLIVALAGALGSSIHSAWKYVNDVDSRRIFQTWKWSYLLGPFVGMGLAIIVYFAVRGGLIMPTGNAEDLNPYGVAAIAALVGMFSKQVVHKLRGIFNVLFRAENASDQTERLEE
ncbi:MAG: hypothetical protein GY774_37040 [Planctomycetes bacterium]|nr:hypothetical protein [Planctomycetota bacterium]